MNRPWFVGNGWLIGNMRMIPIRTDADVLQQVTVEALKGYQPSIEKLEGFVLMLVLVAESITHCFLEQVARPPLLDQNHYYTSCAHCLRR
ncbi:hypothetical protein AM571_CH01135 [Rhizobium etli 8C-3]|uniref:Uncharacterized protein n=1 Tax=Rhizobium etli 8C-3 TaxID=538025 RepID=A0A1L5P1D5_RHIET|nr:hypothetical protein AM571_CH01135 [Rhizobium etli 8C-3]